MRRVPAFASTLFFPAGSRSLKAGWSRAPGGGGGGIFLHSRAPEHYEGEGLQSLGVGRDSGRGRGKGR